MRSSIYNGPIAIWKDAALKSPNKGRVHDNLGVVLKQSDHIPEAMQEFEKAIKLGPDDPLAMNNLATIYCMIGRRRECGALLQKATSIMPDYLDARYNLAIYYYDEGLLDESLQEYNAVIRIAPVSQESVFAQQMLITIQNEKAKGSQKKNR
ncbi:MAG TPA: tetratricopeptide repeat protein [Nitrospirota bacterium]|nr:tetratricopeptide repeat protein [Nitrospirota bacterium]